MPSMQTQDTDLAKVLPVIQYAEVYEFDSLERARVAYRDIVEHCCGVNKPYEFGASTVVYGGTRNLLACVAGFDVPPENVRRYSERVARQYGGKVVDPPIDLVEMIVWRRARALLEGASQFNQVGGQRMFTVRKDGLNKRVGPHGEILEDM